MSKGVKRVMAGEYNRELSSKVFQGACRLIPLGYKQGGTTDFGLRRMLVDQSGQNKAILTVGEHKSLQTDRVVLVPGLEEEVKTVRMEQEMESLERDPKSVVQIKNGPRLRSAPESCCHPTGGRYI